MLFFFSRLTALQIIAAIYSFACCSGSVIFVLPSYRWSSWPSFSSYFMFFMPSYFLLLVPLLCLIFLFVVHHHILRILHFLLSLLLYIFVFLILFCSYFLFLLFHKSPSSSYCSSTSCWSAYSSCCSYSYICFSSNSPSFLVVIYTVSVSSLFNVSLAFVPLEISNVLVTIYHFRWFGQGKQETRRLSCSKNARKEHRRR